MRVYSWNVNGIRAVCRKDLAPWEVCRDADVICLQETKADVGQLPPEITAPRGWTSCWHSAVRKGYSGTAIYCREEPTEILTGIGTKKIDVEGRVLGVRYDDFVVISAYFPNSQDAGARLDYKLTFCRALLRYLRSLEERGYVVLLTGDYNIAHRPIDLARPRQNEANPGYLPEERAWMSRYLGAGYRDVFRDENPELEGAYSWWSFRSGARERNVGWRIDYTCVSEAFSSCAGDARIHADVPGSDHCPVSVRIDAH